MTRDELKQLKESLKGKTEAEYIEIIIKDKLLIEKLEAEILKDKKEKFDTTSEKIMPPKAAYERKKEAEIKRSGRKANDINETTKIKNKFLNGEIKDGDYIGKTRVKIVNLENDKELNNYKALAEDVTVKLEFHPGYYEYVIYVKEKGTYQDDEGNQRMVTASLDDPTEKKVLSSASISHLMIQKYAYGTPINRLMTEFKNNGINVDYNVIIKSMMDIGEKLVPLADEIEGASFTKGKNSNIDETTVKLTRPMKKDDGKTRKNHYVYTMVNNYVTAYRFTGTRSADWLNDLITILNYNHYITTDDYSGYNKLEEHIKGRQLCGAHLRRKIYYAYISLPEKVREREESASRQALKLIDKIFIMERNIKDKTALEKYEYRNSIEYQEAINEFKDFMTKLNPINGTYLSIAKEYCLNNWDLFWTYRNDGDLDFTNTKAELGVKKVALIRKNSLHFNNQESAEINCAILTIIQTALKNKVDLYRYLNYIIHYIGTTDIENLLPWSERLYSLSEDYII